MSDELPELTVTDARAWREWLSKHHDSSGVWLVLAKQNTTEPTSLTYDQALDEALCHGWIDGRLRRRNDITYYRRFTPRGTQSPWSARNVAIVNRLIDAGRMHPAGMTEVDRAKTDGRWDAAYAGQAGIQVPSDLAAALAAEPRAQEMFDILTSQNRYAIVYRVTNTKRSETRARRIAQFVGMLARGETVHPQKRSLGS
jgi:uncharacterized protein YdeI (YjbR/CyaY-like superfamily)